MAELPATVRTETNGPLVSGIAIGFVSVTALFMALRFYTRGAILKNIGKDDWTMLAAAVSWKPCRSGAVAAMLTELRSFQWSTP
jgi:hypothetical protein